MRHYQNSQTVVTAYAQMMNLKSWCDIVDDSAEYHRAVVDK